MGPLGNSGPWAGESRTGGGTGAGPRAAGADGHGAERVSAVRFVFLEGRITAIINPEEFKK